MKFKENETVELKRSTSEIKEAIVSIGAILNKHCRGAVYFGIEDNGRVAGQQLGKSTIKDVSKAISDHIDPKIFPDVAVRKIAGKDCIVVEFSGHEGIYSAYGRFYLRSGEENRRLSAGEIQRLVEKKKNYVYSWGMEVSGNSIFDVHIPTIRSFIKRGREAGRIGFAFGSPKNIFNKLHLVRGNRLLNSGRALFCKDNGLEVQAAVFAGRDKITFLDIQSFRGNLFELIEKAETYVNEHINWRADLSGSKRVEIPEIPVRAVKEAIINSLCHRDFTNPKSNEIAIYRDRIEIFNPGQFPYEYEPEDFVTGNLPSVPRNPLIAEALYLSEDIEKWGSGLRRISQECKIEKIEVAFNKIKSGFLVTFYRPKTRVMGGSAGKGEGEKGATGKKTGEKTGKKTGEKILRLIKENPNMTIAGLSAELGLSVNGIEWNIVKMKKEGLIKRVGPDKGGHWEVLQ